MEDDRKMRLLSDKLRKILELHIIEKKKKETCEIRFEDILCILKKIFSYKNTLINARWRCMNLNKKKKEEGEKSVFIGTCKRQMYKQENESLFPMW